MKFKEFKKVMMGLQLFAGGEGDGADGNGTGEGKSFEDFLEDPKNQAEFDRRVAKALNTQKEKLDGEYQSSLEEAKK